MSILKKTAVFGALVLSTGQLTAMRDEKIQAAVALGSVLKETGQLTNELEKIPGFPKEVRKYALDPLAMVGEFMYNLDTMDRELTEAIQGVKSFAAFNTCSKLKADTLAMLGKTEGEIKAAVQDIKTQTTLLQLKKLCGPVGCTGNKYGCLVQGTENLHHLLAILYKILFGEPEKYKGAVEIVLSIGQQQQIYETT